MPTNEKPKSLAWLNAVATISVLLGLALIGLSAVGATTLSGRSGWTDEKALAYQAASSRVHQLSHQFAATPPEDQSRSLRDQLARAESEYAELRSELDTVRQRPARIAWLLRVGGVLLAALGVVGLVVRRQS